jgi:hypothetical protein
MVDGNAALAPWTDLDVIELDEGYLLAGPCHGKRECSDGGEVAETENTEVMGGEGGILISVEVLPRRSSGVLRLKEEEGQEVTLLRGSGGLRGR